MPPPARRSLHQRGGWRPAALLCATLIMAAGPMAMAGDVVVPVVDAAGMPVEYAVVYLEPPAGPQQASGRRYQVDQRQKRFDPVVSAVQAGTVVEFPNSDNFRHHVYSFSPAKVFSLKLYSGRAAEPITFDQPGIVALGCNIHDRMVAWIVVTPGPWFATTAADGRATLANVPPGTYSLVAWHPSLAAPEPARPVTIASGQAMLQAVVLPAGPLPIP